MSHTACVSSNFFKSLLLLQFVSYSHKIGTYKKLSNRFSKILIFKLLRIFYISSLVSEITAVGLSRPTGLSSCFFTSKSKSAEVLQNVMILPVCSFTRKVLEEKIWRQDVSSPGGVSTRRYISCCHKEIAAVCSVDGVSVSDFVAVGVDSCCWTASRWSWLSAILTNQPSVYCCWLEAIRVSKPSIYLCRGLCEVPVRCIDIAGLLTCAICVTWRSEWNARLVVRGTTVWPSGAFVPPNSGPSLPSLLSLLRSSLPFADLRVYGSVV